MEREVSAGHSLPGEGGGKDKSDVKIKRASERARGTHFLESTRMGKVMTRKERRVKDTHFLERVEEGRSQDTETKRASKREALTSWEAEGGTNHDTGTKREERRALTL
jgi:hypothetical protein